MLTLKIERTPVATIATNSVTCDYLDNRNVITNFNGLPVVRAPKDLGRRGLTNKNIIIHPSGAKLSKVPNGYIILCSYPDCGAIGSKEPGAKDKLCLARCKEYDVSNMLKHTVIVDNQDVKRELTLDMKLENHYTVLIISSMIC